ncbi:MAG: hypothetical protein RLZZ505_2284 [Verrucomicrobiota bacterium]|jgi:hypothetical protein
MSSRRAKSRRRELREPKGPASQRPEREVAHVLSILDRLQNDPTDKQERRLFR